MTAQPDRRRAGTRRGVVAVLLLAALVRLPLFLTPGFDVVAYKIWARVIATVGISGAYGADYPPEPGSAPYHYGPVYLYILRATGLLYTALRPAGGWHDQLLAALLKLSPLIAELALGLLIWSFLRTRISARAALAALAAYLFTPGLIWNTAYWGGIDAFQAFFTTAGLLATVGGTTALAWPLATLAICSKLTALPGALATVPGALRTRSPRGLTVATFAAIATATLVIAPILLGGQADTLVGGIFGHLDIYAETSFNTHNLWWLLTWGQGTRPDTTVVAFGLAYRMIGRALFIVAAAPTLLLIWRFPTNAPRLFATSAYLTFAFCLLTTGVHENWAYTLFAPLLLAAALDRRYRPLYAALAVTFLLNLFLEDPPLHRFVADWLNVRYAIRVTRLINSVAQCALLGWWLWLLCGQIFKRRGLVAGQGTRATVAD